MTSTVLYQYNFEKAGITKEYVLNKQLQQTFDFFDSLIYSDPALDINTRGPITQSQLTQLTTFVEEYVDPPVYLELVDSVS